MRHRASPIEDHIELRRPRTYRRSSMWGTWSSMRGTCLSVGARNSCWVGEDAWRCSGRAGIRHSGVGVPGLTTAVGGMASLSCRTRNSWARVRLYLGGAVSCQRVGGRVIVNELRSHGQVFPRLYSSRKLTGFLLNVCAQCTGRLYEVRSCRVSVSSTFYYLDHKKKNYAASKNDEDFSPRRSSWRRRGHRYSDLPEKQAGRKRRKPKKRRSRPKTLRKN